MPPTKSKHATAVAEALQKGGDPESGDPPVKETPAAKAGETPAAKTPPVEPGKPPEAKPPPEDDEYTKALQELFDDDEEELSSKTDLEDEEITPPPGEPEVPKAPEVAKPVAEKPTEVTPAKPEPVPPVVPPEKGPEVEAAKPPSQPPSEVPKAPEAPKVPEQSPEEIAAARTKWRDGVLVKLTTHFAESLTSEESELLLTEPEKVLPGIMARQYLDTYESVLGAVTQQMPNLLENVMSARTQVETAEKAFFERWPQLNKPEYVDVVTRTVQAYRQANPDAPLDKAIQEAGAMATVTLQLQPAVVPSAETPPGVPSGGAASFSPAAPAAAAAAPPVKKKMGAYEQLAEEMLLDDEGN